jgi:HSP20 family protein
MFGTVLSNFDAGIFDEFRRLENERDQIFGRWTAPTNIRAVQRGTFPPVNVGATPDRVDVYLFAAGLDPKQIEISIQQSLLAVSGIRKVEVKDDADYYRRERFDGEFRRVITLPDDVDPDKVDANYRDGVLQITVQRRESARPRQITVN